MAMMETRGSIRFSSKFNIQWKINFSFRMLKPQLQLLDVNAETIQSLWIYFKREKHAEF